MLRTLISLTAAVCLATAPWSAAADVAAPKIEVGQPFPKLTLPALDDGEPMSIAEFRGRKVLLHVFASW